MKARLLLVLICGSLLLTLPVFFYFRTQNASPELVMQVMKRVGRDDGETRLVPISAGTSATRGDQIQIRLQVRREAYVYLLAHNGSGSAVLLHPASGAESDALLRSNEARIVPGEESFMFLDNPSGIESFYAVASLSALESPASLLARMKAAGDDPGALIAMMRTEFSDVAAATISYSRSSPPATEIALTPPENAGEAPLRAQAPLSDAESAAPSISPDFGSTRPSVRLPDALSTGAGATEPEVDLELAAIEQGLAPPTVHLMGDDELEPESPGGRVSGAAERPSRESAGGAVSASTPLAAPAKDLLLAITNSPDPGTSVRIIDVGSGGNVSSAVVLVVTPTTTGTGVVLDRAGHVLANWHVVRSYTSVSVTFKATLNATPSSRRTRSARVLRLSKTADLALLKVNDLPRGVVPAGISKTNEIRSGEIVHAVGHPLSREWTYTLGKIEQVKTGSSWYAGHDLLHRGTVILAELPEDPGSAGAPLFNGRLELIGIGASPRGGSGVLTGVSVETIRAFLEGSPAQTLASAGG